MLFRLLFIDALLHSISFVLIQNIDMKLKKLDLLEIMKSEDKCLFMETTERYLFQISMYLG